MLLSDVIHSLDDEAVAAETVLGIGDVALLAALQGRAAAVGATLGEYAAWAVRTYADGASSDEWITLIGALGRAPDPGAECLRRAFVWVLANEETIAG